MSTHELADVARAMVAPGKGILAADESDGTIKKRFDSIGVESTVDNRRDYRQLLFTTEGIEEHISGVILFDETARQEATDDRRLVEILESKGILPGIKVDKGTRPLPGAPGEKVTEGLDGLPSRLEEYFTTGYRFAKWRAVISVGDGRPSEYCIRANANDLARYAAFCVEQGLVPLIESDIIMRGPHTLEDCTVATERTLQQVYSKLYSARVPYGQTILQCNMILGGSECLHQASIYEVAKATVECLRQNVPASVPGVVLQSDRKGPRGTAALLNAINIYGKHDPWQLSYSCGWEQQVSALKIWGGTAENGLESQQEFFRRARLMGLAREGQYQPSMEDEQNPANVDLERLRPLALFDTFLSHNSKNRAIVRQIAEALETRNIRPWLDERELQPGRCWQEAVEEIIQSARTALVLVGSDGPGPWELPEMRACLSEFVSRGMPVIPVLLPGAPNDPKLPLFVNGFTSVDLRDGLTDEGLDRLEWGITGEKPQRQLASAR